MHVYRGIDRRKAQQNDEPSICPMTPEQCEILIRNQERLINDMSDVKRYLFVGRIVLGTIICIVLTFEWVRDHVDLAKIAEILKR